MECLAHSRCMYYSSCWIREHGRVRHVLQLSPLSHFNRHPCHISSPPYHSSWTVWLIISFPVHVQVFTFTYIDLFLVRLTLFPVTGVLLGADPFTLLLLLHPASHSSQFSPGLRLCPHPRHGHSSLLGVKLRTWAGIVRPGARLPFIAGVFGGLG